MTTKVAADAAANLLGTLAENPVGAVRGLVESAIALASPAQRQLGRIADKEVPSDLEALRDALRNLKIARQLLETATETLRVILEDVRPTAPGGSA